MFVFRATESLLLPLEAVEESKNRELLVNESNLEKRR